MSDFDRFAFVCNVLDIDESKKVEECRGVHWITFYWTRGNPAMVTLVDSKMSLANSYAKGYDHALRTVFKFLNEVLHMEKNTGKMVVSAA